MKIDKADYFETLSFTEETPNDNWKLLLDEQAAFEKQSKRKKK